MTPSQTLRALLAAGMLARAEHPSDSRAHSVTFTPMVRVRVQAAITVVEQVDAAFFSEVAGRTGSLVELLGAFEPE
jgi:DNA-binding MarR family transcriptional regulator